jgi:hypothetical protein
MKLTKQLIKNFEQEQKNYGTKVALYNVICLIAFGLLKDLGIKHIKTK